MTADTGRALTFMNFSESHLTAAGFEHDMYRGWESHASLIMSCRTAAAAAHAEWRKLQETTTFSQLHTKQFIFIPSATLPSFFFYF